MRREGQMSRRGTGSSPSTSRDSDSWTTGSPSVWGTSTETCSRYHTCRCRHSCDSTSCGDKAYLAFLETSPGSDSAVLSCSK